MRDAADVANCLPISGQSRIKMECQRCNSHRRSVSCRPFTFVSSQRPVDSRVKIAESFERAGAHARYPARSKPIHKTLSDVLG